jgi:micrococcal nuclease
MVSKAETIHGKVIHISDGDTLKVLTSSNKQVRIRLAGIDTPEKAQPFGTKAKQALASLTFQKQVIVDVETKDRYGRTVGRVYVQGVDVSAELVRQGLAWVYRKYTKDQKLYALEVEAKKAKRGLWSSLHPIEPWLWRKGKRTVEHNPSVVKGAIIGNKRSHIYHLPECPSYSMVSVKNRVLFTNESLAKANGYRKAGNCP